MRRRELIAFIAGAAAWPLVSRAEAPGRPLIAFLSSRSPEEAAGHTAAFLDGLKAFGYVDGQSATIEYRWARGQYERLAELARELASLQPAVMVAPGGTPSARAAQSAAGAIPVLFVTSGAVEAGLVAGLNRPERNTSGVDLMTGALGGKRLELLLQLAPKAEIIGVLSNPGSFNGEPRVDAVEAAASSLGRRVIVASASSEADLERSFAGLAERGAGGLVVEPDATFDARRERLIALAAAHRIPAIYHIREFPAAGGLMSYGPSFLDAYYQLGVQAGRVLKGAKIADLPVVRPTKFELVINQKTATALGLTIPTALFAQADEVIE